MSSNGLDSSCCHGWLTESFWRHSLWPLRTACACGLACVSFHIPENPDGSRILETRFIAPVAAILVTSNTLGETLKVTRQVGSAIIWGAISGETGVFIAAFAGIPIYIVHIVWSMVLAYIQAKGWSIWTKMAWAFMSISFCTALVVQETGRLDGKEMGSTTLSVALPMRFAFIMKMSALLGCACGGLVSFVPLPYTRAHAEAASLVAQAEECVAEMIENLTRAQNVPIAASKKRHFDGHHSVANDERLEVRLSVEVPLSVVEATRSWAMHSAERMKHKAEEAVAAAKVMLGHARWEPWWQSEGKGSLAGMPGANYRVFGTADSLDHRLAAVSKCLLLAGGIQRGLEANETFTSGPQPDHLYGLATAEELSDKEEEAKNLVWLANTVQACHDQENQISYQLSMPLTDLTTTLTSVLRGRKLGGDVPDELAGKIKEMNEELFKVRHDLYYTDFWGDEDADRGGKKGSRERQKAANLAFSAWGAPIARFFVVWCMNCICQAMTNPPPSPVPAATFDFQAMVKQWWAEATMRGESTRHKTAKLLYAVKLTISSVVAIIIGSALTGSGVWAAIGVAVMAPRESVRGGGSFRVAKMRMDGTVVGSLYGLFAALYAHNSEGYQGSLGWIHFTLLVLWVLGCGFVREGNSPYGGFVAQFTPFIMVEIPNFEKGGFEYESWALMRISQNMLAVIVFVVVELALLPAMSSLLIKWRLVKDLHFAAKAARAVWDTEMEGMCSKCQHIRSDDADAAIKDLQAGVAKQRELLAEARSEPDWYAWEDNHLKNYDEIIEIEANEITQLLSIMQMTLSHLKFSDETSPTDMEAAIARDMVPVMALLRPEAKKIKTEVVMWLESLADDINTGVKKGLATVIEDAAISALNKFETTLFTSFAQLQADVRAGHRPTPLNEAVTPLYAFVSCTRQLIHALKRLSRATMVLSEYSRMHIALGSSPSKAWRTLESEPAVDESALEKARGRFSSHRRSLIVQETLEATMEWMSDVKTAGANEGQTNWSAGKTCETCGYRHEM